MYWPHARMDLSSGWNAMTDTDPKRDDRRRTRLAAILACLVLASVPARAAVQETPAVESTTAVADERFLDVLDGLARQVERGTYHGVVAVVEVDGERVVEAAFGQRDVAADEPMELDTIFRIYSMTKPITAVAALILVDEGKLELDAPVSRYLPALEGLEVGVEEKDPETGETVLGRVPAEREMTVLDLFRHTAGLTYGIFGDSAVDRLVREKGVFAPGTTNETLVEKLARLPLKWQPGTRFEYSLASDVLG